MVYRKREVEEDVLTLARRRIALMYDRYDQVWVAFSGGKDSTVVFQLCYEEAQRRGQVCNVFHWDEEAMPWPSIEYVRRVSQMPGINFRWLCWPVAHPNACSKDSPIWYPWAPEDKDLWVWPFPPEGDYNYPKEWADPKKRLHNALCNHLLFPSGMGTIGIAMGIRAQESMRRYRSVAQRVEENWIAIDHNAVNMFKRPGIYICKPIYDWRTEDVWTAPQHFGWDYNRSYDVMAKAVIPGEHPTKGVHAGLTPMQQRICPPFGEEALIGLWMYHVCFPEMWDALLARVPGCATAARYSRTPLYGSGSRVTAPPPGSSWQEVVKQELMKWPDKQRAMIVDRIKKEIETHNRKTGNSPIPDNITPGMLSWSFLAQIARRGDFKKRKDKIGQKDKNFDKERYAEQVKASRKRVARAKRSARKQSQVARSSRDQAESMEPEQGVPAGDDPTEA